MKQLRCLAPVASANARVLILGSMPGKRSLAEQRYYAHPQNAFWPIVTALLGEAPSRSYEQRLQMLEVNRIALWDVLAACRRRGSMDAAIDADSVQANDFRVFLGRHRKLRAVFFNGAKSEQVWMRHVAPGLPPRWRDIYTQRLPSTSPAYAAMPFEQKLDAWTAVVRCLSESRA